MVSTLIRPRLLRWVLAVALAWLAVMLLLRGVFYLRYNPVGKGFSGSAFLMGLRFDARVAAVLALGMLLLCCCRPLNPFVRYGAARFWNILLTVLFAVMLVFYGADYYHYDYLRQRLNAGVLSYAGDAAISAQMMWQSYPLVTILLLLTGTVLLARLLWGWLLRRYQWQDEGRGRKAPLAYTVAVLLLGLAVFGKLGQFPLRWSDAFTLSDDFKANLALNPFQSFFSTLSFRNSQPDVDKVRQHYPEMAALLGVERPDAAQLAFGRRYPFADSGTARRPNVVLVICESFSAYKSSMWGNPLNTTPYFNGLCEKGVFFSRCFTPAYGTARGVWATITGIPDVQRPQTASRNPGAVDQHTIINDFSGYDKYYFLGGDPTWANIQGVLANNIAGLNIYSQSSFKAKKIDVWGISDKNLLLEANGILSQQQKPFFAIIQTADNHRPYTIPAEDLGQFKKLEMPQDSLARYGFESNAEMNAFRYTDFCFEAFMKAAQKEKYFGNTLFVFVGDHGIRGNAGGMLPRAYTDEGLTCLHVPLLFYAPEWLPAKKVADVCSQVDILPSIAGLLRVPYRNAAMGRNLFGPANAPAYAFMIDHDEQTIGVLNNQYCYRKSLKGGTEHFVSLMDDAPVATTPATDSVRQWLRRLTAGYFETAKWMLVNNKKM
jgi:phosphoglycerol transferase MdoB-like AlkP superfamily enzyme